MYGAKVQPGDTVVVLGLGGIGMNAVQGARIAGASRIIGIDPSEFNRSASERFGTTHTFASAEEALPAIQDLTRGQMANSALITVGTAVPESIGGAVSLVGKLGVVLVVALGDVTTSSAVLPLFELTAFQKSIVGCLFGNANPRFDIPKLLELYQRGELLLDELVTKTYTLDQINEGYEDLRQHRNIRGVIHF